MGRERLSAVRQILRALDPVLSQEFGERILRQDWYAAPAALRAWLREICAGEGDPDRQLGRQLAAAPDSETRLAIISLHAPHSARVVRLLGLAAVTALRQRHVGERHAYQSAVIPVGRTLAVLRRRLVASEAGKPMAPDLEDRETWSADQRPFLSRPDLGTQIADWLAAPGTGEVLADVLDRPPPPLAPALDGVSELEIDRLREFGEPALRELMELRRRVEAREDADPAAQGLT